MQDVWYAGCFCYIGVATDGLQYERHTFECKPGMWLVKVTGWTGMRANAVMDDFGNLVRVA